MKKESYAMAVVLILLASMIVSGFDGFGSFGLGCEEKAKVLVNACKMACYEAINNGTDLSKGPCLLDPMSQDTNWVCDIAHKPRENIDNERENQCNSWHNGTSKHFIELTPECEFITAN
ncbi:MAG: hypothetical protein K6T16_01820 [Candidatus Pacearchaeota archaeon]|nr:hypothetical protein [Candidatus Pacearchaeota archaeon]